MAFRDFLNRWRQRRSWGPDTLHPYGADYYANPSPNDGGKARKVLEEGYEIGKKLYHNPIVRKWVAPMVAVGGLAYGASRYDVRGRGHIDGLKGKLDMRARQDQFPGEEREGIYGHARLQAGNAARAGVMIRGAKLDAGKEKVRTGLAGAYFRSRPVGGEFWLGEKQFQKKDHDRKAYHRALRKTRALQSVTQRGVNNG